VSIFDRITEAKKAYDALVSEAGTERAMAEVFKEIFAKYPLVKALGWHQYTPYFNDGESCTFGIGEVSASLREVSASQAANERGYFSEEDEDDYEEDLEEGEESSKPAEPLPPGGWFSGWGLDKEGLTDDHKAQIKGALDAVHGIMFDDVFLRAFGDHAVIVATPDGIHINEFSHD
jgi:hypothetical protein